MPRHAGKGDTFYRVTEHSISGGYVHHYGPYATIGAAKSFITRELKQQTRNNRISSYTYSVQVLTGEWVECDLG